MTTLQGDHRVLIPMKGSVGCFLTCCVMVGGIVMFFSGIAIFNLAEGEGRVVSIIWLSLVAIWLVAMVTSLRTWNGLVIAVARNFSREAFVEIRKDPGAPQMLRPGFHAFNREFFDDPIAIARIGEVSWHARQASSMSKRDCDDWSVAVWSDRDDLREPWGREHRSGKDIRIVTPSLSRAQIDTVGRWLVEMLITAGVPLVWSEKESQWREGVVFVRKVP